MHMFENLEKRKKRGQGTAQATAEETKLEAGEAEVPSLTAGNCVPNTGAGGGVSTRRTSFATVVVTFYFILIFLKLIMAACSYTLVLVSSLGHNRH